MKAYHQFTLGLLVLVSLSLSAFAQQTTNRPYMHPDVMPKLAAAGEYSVGVKTTTILNANYTDPVTQQKGRSLTVEVWYPSKQAVNNAVIYEDEMRSGQRFSLKGLGQRDLSPSLDNDMPFVVISHGYTGYRTIMFYLAEHLASHGYVVAAIDHTDSTNADVDFTSSPFSGFMSTLLHRSWDQQRVLDHFGQVSNIKNLFGDSNTWQADVTGLVGYSMGGYGAINTVGGCYDFPTALVGQFIGSQDAAQIAGVKALLDTCASRQGQDSFNVDKRWSAMIAFAPWGGQHGIFTDSTVQKIDVPSLFISGDHDDVSGYAGIQSVYENIESADAFFLTYLNARHNIAVHKTPDTAWTNELDFGHYFESAWSSIRLNQINQHFSLAMFDCYLKKQANACEFLNLPKDSHQQKADGSLGEPWKGFGNRYSTGMQWQQKTAKTN